MIFYRPTDGDVQGGPINWQPRSCFIMSAMGKNVPRTVGNARRRVASVLADVGFKSTDASTLTTGKDYLLKIWSLAVCSPVGVAVVHEGIRPETMANVFYELGLMQAYGRETVVVRVGEVALPSDLVRTEYIQFDAKFTRRFSGFVATLAERAEYYLILSQQLESDPLLAIDYLRRSYLLSGNEKLRGRAQQIFRHSRLSDRAKDSVERNLVRF